MSLNTTPRTWVSGEVVTAAQMNTEIRDAFTGIQAAWTAYTPAWTASTTAPVLGNGTLVGAYNRVGKTVDFRIVLTMGSTTTYGAGFYVFSLPVTPVAAGINILEYPVADVICHDASPSAVTPGIGAIFSTSEVRPRSYAGATITPTAPFTFASGDRIMLAGRYEAA